jgi:carbohydrate diacid regulator
VLRLEDHRLPLLFWRYRQDWLAQDVIEPVGRLQHYPQLLDTLSGWLAHNCESQTCAEALGIHRNSLRYRLDRIAEVTGCNPYHTDDLLRLYLGVQMAERPS